MFSLKYMYINESTYLRKYKCSLFLLWHVFIWLFREIKCTCDKKTNSTPKNQLRRIHVLYKEGFCFCKVDKFLPHIFLGAYKMATKMTLTYVKMTCFFSRKIFSFSYLLKIKLSKHTLDYVLDASMLVLLNYVSVRTESCVM